MKTLPGCALVLVFLAACAGAPGEIKLTASDSGKTLDAAPNQVITITLDSNPTTGFKWNLVAEPDAKVLKLVASKYNAPSAPLPGAGGTET